MSYGLSITLEQARTVATAALKEAAANQWTMAVAIVDAHGDLLYFERMDGTPLGSTGVCQDKARSAARFKRPTRVFQDMLASGGEGLRVLRITGAVPVEGGLPIVKDGLVIGAVGLSGGTSPQDGQCAQAGLNALT